MRKVHRVPSSPPQTVRFRGVVRGEDRRELTPEAGETGETERRHRTEPEDPSQVRRPREEPPSLLSRRCCSAPGSIRDEEEHSGDQTVRDHPEDRGVDSEVGERGDAEHHEAHVCDRGERDQALHISLRETTQGAVDDADHRQEADPGCPVCRGLREHGQRDADEPVRTELQEDRRQQDRTHRGRLGMCVGKPGVEREHRDLDREPEEQPCEQQHCVLWTIPAAVQVRQHHHVERVHLRQEEQRQERQQHHRRAEQREEEELDRRVLAVRSAPHTDHEEHRQQDDLEEDEEEDQVLRDEVPFIPISSSNSARNAFGLCGSGKWLYRNKVKAGNGGREICGLT